MLANFGKKLVCALLRNGIDQARPELGDLPSDIRLDFI